MAVIFCGCVRYIPFGVQPGDGGSSGAERGPDARLLADGRTLALEGPRADRGRPSDRAADNRAADKTSGLVTAATLTNTGKDPLNAKASGMLSWKSCAPTFTGELVVGGLAAGSVYQLKLQRQWSVSYATGKALGSIGRTWDNTVWTSGDTKSLLPSPYTGAASGNEPASNIGDYMTAAQQDTLYAAGHDLLGYLVFAHFRVVDASNAELTEDDVTPAKKIAATAGQFHIPFYADFSWRTSSSPQKGAITMPDGSYNAEFLVTREASGAYLDPLVVSSVTFTVASSGVCP